jgi:hypothetical protein
LLFSSFSIYSYNFWWLVKLVIKIYASNFVFHVVVSQGMHKVIFFVKSFLFNFLLLIMLHNM